MSLSNFIHQKSYEKIVFRLHRHPIVTFPACLSFILFLILPVFLYWFGLQNFPTIFENQMLLAALTILLSTYCLAIGLFYYTYFVNYYLDILVITNDRLLHIEQEGVFSRNISEVDLYKIQDVTSTVNGFFPSLLNYGSLLIQTAGAVEKFQIDDIPNPEDLRQQILDLAEGDRKFHLANLTTKPII
jgi:uncharacterized membrane protein YdbT with pleckstrin-like domain